MKQVIFFYDDNKITRHNAEGLHISAIVKLVGQVITEVFDVLNTETDEIESIEMSHRIVRAEIY